MAAEVAILAGFVTVVGEGVKLSISLYDFASTLGHAGEEMKDLGTEVTSFCAVMRQVRSSLTRAKSFRISSTAIQDVHDLLDQGKEIFKKIHNLLAKSQGKDVSTTDIFSRVKWTFQKSKVLMLKESLRSCTAMIHVMLTTMVFAERIASTEARTPATEAEDEQLREMMQSWLLVQHNTNLRLEQLEDQAILEETEEIGSHVPEVSDSSNPVAQASVQQRRDHGHMLSCDRSQRTSVIINGKIFQGQDPRDSQRRTLAGIGDQRLSVIQTNGLLKNWTDQSDPLVPYCLSQGPDFYSNILAPQIPMEGPEDHQRTRSGDLDQDLQHPSSSEANDDNIDGLSVLDHAPEPDNSIKPSSIGIPKSFRVSRDDPCWKILPAALRKCNIQADWRQYVLYIYYGNAERQIGTEEKPLTIFEDLDREGKKPVFTLRKLASPSGISDHVHMASITSPGVSGSNAGPARRG